MLTKEQLRQILDELPDRETRSGLGPYRELVIEMRRRKYSHRAISRVLMERCGLEISHSAVHKFVKRHCRETLATSTPPDVSRQPAPGLGILRTKPAELCGEPEPPQKVRERIAALKRRSHVAPPDQAPFQFDASQPLRLVDEGE